MMQLCGIIFVNSFEMPFNKQAVFATASLFEHDCVANATRSFTSEGNIVIRAAVPISRGQNISLNYIDPLWGKESINIYLFIIIYLLLFIYCYLFIIIYLLLFIYYCLLFFYYYILLSFIIVHY